MRIENLTELITANDNLIGKAKSKKRSLTRLKDWVAGFEPDDPPSQAQLDVKIAKLGMADLQTAFDAEKAVFLNAEVINPPIEE